MSWRHTSPSGQMLLGSVTSQGVVQLQFEPQTLSASPHSRSGLVTRQLTGQQTRWERRRPKQPPLFSPHSRSAAQSRSLLHSSPVPQGGQLPPQSTAVSLPSLTPFVQCPGWHAGSSGLVAQGPSQSLGAQPKMPKHSFPRVAQSVRPNGKC